VRRAAVAAALLLLAAPAVAEQPELLPLDLAHVADVVGAPRAPRLTGAALEAEAQRVGEVLRCPVCQGLSVADSPSTMATHMRQQVREMVGAGFDEEQVLSYFEASYGEFVRLEPPLRGVNWLVWLAPLGGLAVGAGVVFWALRSARGGASPSAAEAPRADDRSRPASDPPPDDPELARALRRVREMAYGAPGGEPPEPS
jgi:cytochrome c-type biogenesis protein CcmH